MSSVPAVLAGLARTIIAHNRLEPRPRSAEFNRSLRAEVRDPAWLLARQWQLKEFRAEDRGSPAFTDLSVRTARPTRLQAGAGPAQQVSDYDPQLPWEAQLQAQPTAVDDGLRLRMGLAWLRQLRENGLLRFAAGFRASYPLLLREETFVENSSYDVAYAQAQTSSELQDVLQALRLPAADGSVRLPLDGYKLFLALQADPNAAGLVVESPAEGATRDQLTALGTTFRASYQRLYFGRSGASGWSVPTLSYNFALALPGAAAGEAPTVLAAEQHPGGPAQWYSVDEAPAPAYPALAGVGAGASELPPLRTIPTEIEFIGSPNARWWAFEDHRVDFGRVSGDSSDFGRMLLQEFVFLYQNDWFSIPCSVPVGSLTTVTSLVVTDVFGQRYRVPAAGASTLTEGTGGPRLDDDRGRWSLFGQSQVGARTAQPPRVLIAHPALTPLVGQPVEQVMFTREEATNLVWAVEHTIPNGFGGGMDGAGAASRVAEYLRARTEVPAPDAAAAYAYRLMSSVPEHWIPFVSRPDAAGVSYLEQGELPRQVDGQPLPALSAADRTVQPRSPLLRLGGPTQPYLVQEHQVPPTGLQVEGAYRRARGLNGRVALWYEYQRRPARRAGGSGLQFDQLLTGAAS